MKYKSYRNLLSTLLKQNKQNYCKQYFKSKYANVKNLCKSIKSFVTLQIITSSVPRMIYQGKNTITNPCDIANIINNYLSSVAETTKQNIKYFHKHLQK